VQRRKILLDIVQAQAKNFLLQSSSTFFKFSSSLLLVYGRKHELGVHFRLIFPNISAN